MHETTVRVWRRVVVGAAALALLVLGVVLVVRLLRSDEERISEAIDDATEALNDRQRDEFLAFFAPEIRYRGRDARAAPDADARRRLERDLDEWIGYRVIRLNLRERAIRVDGDRAEIRLTVSVGDLFRSIRDVDVRLEAARTDDGWKVQDLRWK